PPRRRASDQRATLIPLRNGLPAYRRRRLCHLGPDIVLLDLPEVDPAARVRDVRRVLPECGLCRDQVAFPVSVEFRRRRTSDAQLGIDEGRGCLVSASPGSRWRSRQYSLLADLLQE